MMEPTASPLVKASTWQPSIHNVGRAEPAKIAHAIHDWSVLQSIDAVEESSDILSYLPISSMSRMSNYSRRILSLLRNNDSNRLHRTL